jgi:hypothetical protein
MVIVMAIIGMIAGISYPAVSSGLETIRLSSACDDVVSLVNGAVNRVERRQEIVEMLVSLRDNSIVLHSTQEGFERKLELPDGISIEAILPADPEADRETPRRFILIPGGTAPRIAIQLINRKNSRRIVRLDPMTGIPRIEVPLTEEK